MLLASSEEIYFLISNIQLNRGYKNVNYGIGSIQRQPYLKGGSAGSVVGDDRIWIKPYALLGCSATHQQGFLPMYIPSEEKREGINIIIDN